MSKKTNKFLNPSGDSEIQLTPEEPKAVDPIANLPEVHSLGFCQLPGKGWVVLRITTEGNQVISKELVDDAPTPKAVAMERFRIEVAKMLLGKHEKAKA